MTSTRDPGLQPERTELSWQRTLLAVVIGTAASIRVLEPLLGLLAITAGASGAVAAAAVWLGARRRHRRVLLVFRGLAAPEAMPGGALLLALTLLVGIGATLCLLTTAIRG